MSTKLMTLTLTAALMGGTAIADVPRVAVDIAPVHSLVARVMQGVGEPDLIIQSGASPHEYSLRPSEAAALQSADFIFWIGPDLTPWLEDTLDTLSPNATKTALMETEGTVELEFRESALFEAHDHGDHEEHDHEEAGHDEHKEHEHEDHEHEEAGHDEHEHEEAGHDEHKEHEHEEAGHDEHKEHEHEEAGHDEHEGHENEDHHDHAHGAHDPHAWLSPQNASMWLNAIAAKLSAADPDNAGAYFANAAAGRAEIDALIEEVDATLDPVRDGQFIVFHDAYQYFEVAFDFPAAGAISIGDASDPGPARIAEIQARIADQGIDCVLAEPQFNPDLIATVLDGTEAKTGVLDPLGSSLELGPTLYPALISNLADTLAECM